MRRSSIWDALIGHTRLAPLEEEEFKVGGGGVYVQPLQVQVVN